MAPPEGGGEKTEKATPKKREDARKRGQVKKSAEVNTALSVIVMFVALRVLWSLISSRAAMLMENSFNGKYLLLPTLGAGELHNVFVDMLVSGAVMALPIMGIALVVGVVANYLQVGFLFTTKPLKPSFSKINPLQGFKRMFSMQSLVELLKSLLKVTIIGLVVYNLFINDVKLLPAMMLTEPAQAMAKVLDMAFQMGLVAGIALVAIAAADYGYQWFKYEKDLRMTKQEIKDEYKMLEGDPQVKGQIKQKQRQMSQMRMMSSVPEADVIVTNPTHYAVALKYDEGKSAAPIVIAKGKDIVAQRIKEIAREHNIEIFENKPLAQALYSYCEIGDQVPEELYSAVAEVLAYVYKLKNPMRGNPERSRA